MARKSRKKKRKNRGLVVLLVILGALLVFVLSFIIAFMVFSSGEKKTIEPINPDAPVINAENMESYDVENPVGDGDMSELYGDEDRLTSTSGESESGRSSGNSSSNNS